MIERKNIDPTGYLRQQEEAEVRDTYMTQREIEILARSYAGGRFRETDYSDYTDWSLADACEDGYLAGVEFVVKNIWLFKDKLDYCDLRGMLEAYGDHIATRREEMWLTKPMTAHDKQMVAWAETLSETEWVKIRPDDADTYEGWKALDDIQGRLYRKEEYGSGMG